MDQLKLEPGLRYSLLRKWDDFLAAQSFVSKLRNAAFMYAGCPTIPILLENPESRPICDRDRKNPDFDSCWDIFVKFS